MRLYARRVCLKVTFNDLSRSPTEIAETQLQVIANLALRAYNSDSDTLGAARVDAVSLGLTETSRSLLPSMAALKQHTKRSAHIAGHLWGMAYENNPELPPFTEWGWEMTENGDAKPVWTKSICATEYMHPSK